MACFAPDPLWLLCSLLSFLLIVSSRNNVSDRHPDLRPQDETQWPHKAHLHATSAGFHHC